MAVVEGAGRGNWREVCGMEGGGFVAVEIADVMSDNHFGRTAAAPSNKRNSMHKMTTFSFGIL